MGVRDPELEGVAQDLRTELAEVEATLAELTSLRAELLAQLQALEELEKPPEQR